MGGDEGREGDWECSGCGNRNYAFRSFCNRCKQPRLLVDTKTPADSKWLPRIGDWICTGCTNNNYASREKCKKCGQPKEVAAMPAIAMPGASFRTHPHYFARARAEPEQMMNIGLLGNGAFQQSLPLSFNWSIGGADRYGVQPASPCPSGGNQSSGLPYANQANQFLMVPKGWRNGDWICSCGFHNYASRAQCKKCNASMPPVRRASFRADACFNCLIGNKPIKFLQESMPYFDGLDILDHMQPSCISLGTKRLASEEFAQDWNNKRLNAGHTHGLQQAYPGFEQMAGSDGNQTTGLYPPYLSGSSAAAPNFQVNLQLPHSVTTPTILGKGAKQWRDGDWMCTNCNNHNYASRSECNRCKTQREGFSEESQPVSVS